MASENARQEIELSLGGKVYSVRPDFATISGIEGVADQPARTLGMKAMAGAIPLNQRPANVAEISLTELALVVFLMLKGKKGAPESATDVGNLLMEEGYGHLLMPVGQFLVRAQRGNKEHEKEAAAQGTAPDDPTAEQKPT